jgi:hypothetical protein
MKLLSEPLFHFLLLGALIFAAFKIVAPHRTKPGEIVVTQGTLENIVTGFTRTWQRPPTDEELQGLVRDYVREEAAYREALVMGLDRDDTIIRRRLRQKLEFLSDSLAAQAEPSDAELQVFLQSHADNFKTEPTFSFRHVYLSPQSHGANLQRDETRLLAKLRQRGSESDTRALGDPFLLESHFNNISLAEVKKIFGNQFALDLVSMQPDQWQGPLQSGYGAHFVLLSERTDGHLPALAEVRDQVLREWVNARRIETTDKFYQRLLERYTIRIEPPEEKKVAQVHQ